MENLAAAVQIHHAPELDRLARDTREFVAAAKAESTHELATSTQAFPAGWDCREKMKQGDSLNCAKQRGFRNPGQRALRSDAR